MRTILVLSLFAALGCGGGRSSTGTTIINGPTPDGGTSTGTVTTPNCTLTNAPANGDQDADGYSPAQGDCNDCNPSINPGAVQIPGDPTDYACNGMPGVVQACDTSLAGKRDATSLTNAMDLCDSRFLMSATLVGPSTEKARKVITTYGVINPKAGAAMSLISNGIAAAKNDPDFDASVEEDPGTAFDDSNTYANPLPNLPGVAGCSQSQPSEVNDYTELVVKLKAPTNVNSFSFDFQFFSAEYPVFVCTEYNDEFLVLQESPNEFGATLTNIAFDKQKNAVTINNGFFTVCQNDSYNTHADNCTSPLTGISGTGFEDQPIYPETAGPDANIPGGSTGWLTTTSPVTPGEVVTLHFIIFDEGDHVLDSAALIDNFRWGTSVVSTPSTNPIQ